MAKKFESQIVNKENPNKASPWRKWEKSGKMKFCERIGRRFITRPCPRSADIIENGAMRYTAA